ncbi:MAG TPA: DoxX family protein [Flavobacteriales bacterium]|nr:DoxX family protein [Flavobacteriales bacterium]HMR27137.1 DoxX family protein [Flavobacteriales bacterium]
METGILLGYTGIDLLRLAFSAMVAILFLQSGLDKALDWKGNLTWLTGHFAKSPLKGMVPLMLAVITAIELSAGACAGIGLVQVALRGDPSMGAWGCTLGALAITLLFFGQRVAKDYAGAASLVSYFLLCAGGMWVYMG